MRAPVCHSTSFRSESSPGRILDCDGIFVVAVVGGLRSESSPGRILDCDFLFLNFYNTVYFGLNHLQGEYWIATTSSIGLFSGNS